MRLLVLIEAATVTGPAKNLLEFCQTVRGRDDIHISVATFDRNRGATGFSRAAESAGIPVTLISERSAVDLHVVWRIRDLVDSANPDIVQTHAVKSHFLVYMSRVWRHRRWVAFHHGYTTTDTKDRIYSQLDRGSLRAAARVFTVSQAFKQQLVERGVSAARIVVVQNAVNLAWADGVRALDRQAVRAQLGIAPDERVLLAIGRMSQEKRHIDLIEAHRLLRDKRLRLILVGDGPERMQLEASAGEGVTFTGQVQDTAMYYAASDVMVLPSLTEGSPNVLLEAMACGVPSVATYVGGIPEIVKDGESALLAPPSDSAALARAIRTVLDDGELRTRLVSNARRAIEARHTPETRAEELMGRYRSVIADATKPIGALP
ncbi:MAG TPA: glycosyltransferase family 4 protein [Bryobacteraceae bacterium]|nr:glycosyltransferase family 4 protein [Bryobacteraceae bacterium]